MKINRIPVLLALVFFCVFTSCKKQAPQLPSNKGDVVDENASTLLNINQNLAAKEDSILEEYTGQDPEFKRSELGFWFKIEKRTDRPILKEKDNCSFTCRVSLLDGKLLQEDEKNVIIGKKQLIVGLEEGLKLLHKGESATFIIPWYLGYGMKGDDQEIPPYTSLIYQIKLIE